MLIYIGALEQVAGLKASNSVTLEDVSEKVLDHRGDTVSAPLGIARRTASIAEGALCNVARDRLEGESKAKILRARGGACKVLLVGGCRRSLRGVDEGDNVAELALLTGGAETARGVLGRRGMVVSD